MTRQSPYGADIRDGSFVIVGAGGHGREALDIVDAWDSRATFLGFVDDAELDDSARERVERRACSVLGTTAWLMTTGHRYALGIGTSEVRRKLDDRLQQGSANVGPLRLVHPSASIGSDVQLAPGVFVGANATITTNVRIGRNSHINVGCAVQHDTTIGDYVTVSPGTFINGDVSIGDDVFIGTGAVITRGCTVGDGAVIGAGSVVLHDVSAGSRIVGIPGRTLP